MAPTKVSTRKAPAVAPPEEPRPKARMSDQMLQRAKRASTLLKHLSGPSRLHIVLLLAGGEENVGFICEELGQSQPAVSHHLALMRHGGILSPRRQGKKTFYGLTTVGQQLASVAGRLTGDL